jgi:DNA-directed RNA polymerase specialized sigma24 family protein
MQQPQREPNFLDLFGSDPTVAKTGYDRLRKALIRFFSRRGVLIADDLADEVILRVYSKFCGKTDIRNVSHYAHGTAKLVMHEWLRAKEKDAELISNLPAFLPEADSDLRYCLNHCMTTCLSPEKLEILMQYAFKEQDRNELAASHGLNTRALALRVFRYRNALADCLEECVRSKSRNKSGLLALILRRGRQNDDE